MSLWSCVKLKSVMFYAILYIIVESYALREHLHLKSSKNFIVLDSALVTTRQLEFYIVFVQLVNASLFDCKLEFI